MTTKPQAAEKQNSVSPGRAKTGAILTGIGGVIMLVNGVLLLTGNGGSSGLTVLGAALVIIGMWLRGQLKKKL